MMRKRFFSLSVLLLISIYAIGATGSASSNKKLTGALKDLSDYYKVSTRFSSQAFGKMLTDRAINDRQKAGIMIRAKSGQPAGQKLLPESSKVVDEKGNQSGYFPIIKKTVILDEVQKRWGNPDYDVLLCNILYTGDSRSIESDKVRVTSRTKLGGENEYLLVCEFASTELNRLAALPEVIRISPKVRQDVNNDQGTFWTGASAIRMQQGTSFTKGYTGQNALVGIIDTGIDWTHEDFIDPLTGSTRVLFIWDTEVDTVGKAPSDLFGGILSGLDYGTVWTQSEIDAGVCTATDTHGHGTHVAGSAAGNGAATGRYAGMAPNAMIIFVKGLDNNGALFIDEMASRAGKPCAYNMSYGPSLTFHYMALWPEDFPADNTSMDALYFQSLNDIYGPGFIPVKAAGNDGHWNTYTGSTPPMIGAYHIEGQLAAGQSGSHVLNWYADYATVWTGYGQSLDSNNYPYSQIGIWYTAPIQITMISPDGGVMGPIVHGGSGFAYTNLFDGWTNYTLDNPVASNGAYYGTMSLEWCSDPASDPVPGDWQIIVEAVGGGSANYDMWIGQFGVIAGGAYMITPIRSYFTGNYSHANYIIHEGASDHIITVGNFATRNGWTDINGNNWSYVSKPIIGQINNSSSPGPSRDRRVKPDIAAPGSIILSSASKDGSSWENTAYLVDPKHGAMSGTSMASPHVCGGVALMLSKNRWYTVESLRSTIALWAHHDWFTDSGSPNAWGFGKFEVTALNDAPVAQITTSKTEIVLDDMEYTVVYDGSGSYDPEDFPITHTFSNFEALENNTEDQAPTAHSFTQHGASVSLEVDPDVEAKYRVSLKVNDGMLDSQTATSAWVTTKFYPILPPANLQVVRTEIDLILFKLFTNTVTWQLNPENKSKVKEYILYVKEKGADDSTYQVLGNPYLPGSELKYEIKGLMKNQLYTYKVVAVNMRDVVSDPVVAGN